MKERAYQSVLITKLVQESKEDYLERWWKNDDITDGKDNKRWKKEGEESEGFDLHIPLSHNVWFGYKFFYPLFFPLFSHPHPFPPPFLYFDQIRILSHLFDQGNEIRRKWIQNFLRRKRGEKWRKKKKEGQNFHQVKHKVLEHFLQEFFVLMYQNFGVN